MAVFISYAREDLAAARRIAEALRAAGVEVWFDENELRGGEVWDAKIRRQIDGCSLFMPLISAQTQAREKGYFRLEWKLAVDQVHLLAAGTPFVAPVVVDDTAESEALVPPEFMRFHWTRLPGALPTLAFVEQTQRLLRREPTRPRSTAAAGASMPAPQSAADSPGTGRPRSYGLAGTAVAVLVVAATAWHFRHANQAAFDGRGGGAEPQTEAGAPAKSIAVLPFSNFSSDKENEFFVDGLHDEVITALAHIHDLKVISRTSVLAYRNPEGRNLKKIAADLDVANVLEGSVQRMGNEVHLNVQLIDARNDQHLWAESYTREVTNLFSAEADLASAVTTALRSTLSSDEKEVIARRPTASPVAYDYYLHARVLDQELNNQAPVEDWEHIVELYRLAAEADPKFLEPHAYSAILQGTMYWFPKADATPRRRQLAWQQVEAARAIDPDAPETHLAEGAFEYSCNTDWKAALARYELAQTRMPNDGNLAYRIALAHRRLGEWDQVLAGMKRAEELSPNDSNVASAALESYIMARRYDEARTFVASRHTRGTSDSKFYFFTALLRYQTDGDRVEFGAALKAIPGPDQASRNRGEFIADLMLGDWAAADRVAAKPGFGPIVNSGGAVQLPAAQCRAALACLQHRPDDARRFAAEALAWWKQQHLPARQQPWVAFEIAKNEAYAGNLDAALAEGRAALDEESLRDRFDLGAMKQEFGEILILAGKRAEALRLLRELVATEAPQSAPFTFRILPFWSQLASDPQFDAIVASARPL